MDPWSERIGIANSTAASDQSQALITPQLDE